MASKPRARLQPVPLDRVRIEDSFWTPRMETNRAVTLPIEYEQNKKTGALEGYQWAWDPPRPPRPWRIWLGDVTKWIEAAAYALMSRPDERLVRMAADAVENVLKGQKPDGYLYANPIAPEKRWTNLRDQHEMYDVGHAIEAAVAWRQATGDGRFLDAMRRCADLLDATFGPQPGKKRGYDGHPEIELALVKLYRATGERRYLDLARFFVDERGRQPCHFDEEAVARGEDPKRHGGRSWMGEPPYSLFQAHRPVRRQTDAIGHAVRALYLYSGMADVAIATGDAALLATCRRLWQSVTRRRMYVTGGVGSSASGEALTFDYDLPNETAYAETCASIALVFFAHRMLQIDADGEYADVMERALYNGVLSGISLDGRRFFYANPLAVHPDAFKDTHGHISATRREWFGCACCPPNIARMIAQLPGCIYSTGRRELYVHMYVQGRADVEVAGQSVQIVQRTTYPWEGEVAITVSPEKAAAWTLALRVPGWCRRSRIKINGKPTGAAITKGYLRVRRRWERGDKVDLALDMPPERIEAHPLVRQDCGRIALQRGPVVYCLEEVDNGKALNDIVLPRKAMLTVKRSARILNGIPLIVARGERRGLGGWGDALYRSSSSKKKPVTITALPYSVWANRKPGEMLVWIRER